jgi:predicted nucleic acid-binding protein
VTEAVCDAGPLIHIDELGCLDLLADFSPLSIPRLVLAEVVRHRPSFASGAIETARLVAAAASSSELATLVRVLALDAGEQVALAWCVARPAALLLTDDSAARLAARALGVRAYGTLGVLLRSIRRQQRSRDEVIDLLRSLPNRSTLHVRARLLQQVIDEVEQAV